jgi:hypothetical protein
MLSIEKVARQMEQLLNPVAARLAQETGWARRRSKLTGPLFVQTLVLGWLRAPPASSSPSAPRASTSASVAPRRTI